MSSDRESRAATLLGGTGFFTVAEDTFRSHYPLVSGIALTLSLAVMPLNLAYHRMLARREGEEEMEITFFLSPNFSPSLEFVTIGTIPAIVKNGKKRERSYGITRFGLLGVFNIVRRKESRLEGVALALSILRTYSV